MAYERRPLKRQKVRYNSDNDDNLLVYQLVVDDEKVTPTSATIAIYKPGTSTAVLSATAMTKSGTLLTYAVDTTTTANYPVGEGYRGEIITTYDSKTYNDVLMFDVCKFLLTGWLTRDQLIDRDDSLLAAEHAGDENFPGLISSSRDELQILVEARAFADGHLLEDMILEHGKFATVMRLYVLETYHRNKGHTEKADKLEEKFDTLWAAFLNGIRYDKNQDGEESTDVGGIVRQKLVL
jgi:hypothetical protein